MTREDAKVFMRKEWRECMKGSFAESAFEIAIEALEQPERKKGKWILVKGSNGKDYHKCSECLHTQEITGVKNYCAVCGADMREDGVANADVES